MTTNANLAPPALVLRAQPVSLHSPPALLATGQQPSAQAASLLTLLYLLSTSATRAVPKSSSTKLLLTNAFLARLIAACASTARQTPASNANITTSGTLPPRSVIRLNSRKTTNTELQRSSL